MSPSAVFLVHMRTSTASQIDYSHLRLFRDIGSMPEYRDIPASGYPPASSPSPLLYAPGQVSKHDVLDLAGVGTWRKYSFFALRVCLPTQQFV